MKNELSPNALPANKPDLRTWARTRRATLNLSPLSEILIARVAAQHEYAAAKHILLYLAMPGEINIEGLCALAPTKNWYIPRCAPNRRLAIHAFTPGDTPLTSGPWGIREPGPAQSPEIALDVLDLVLVPALMLSSQGDRLGYGGGYYDRFLPRLRTDCVTVGVLPDTLIVPTLPRDPWDVPLKIIVTETSIYRYLPHRVHRVKTTQRYN